MKKEKHEKMFTKLKHTLTKEELILVEKLLESERDKIKTKFPFIVTIIGVFGVVATLYGIEKLIDMTPLSTMPWFLFIIGIILLLITGYLYEKL